MEKVSLKIEKLIYGGSGIGFLEGLPVFVPMTIPGDEIECGIVKQHKGYAEGVMLKMLKPSPNRALPKCEHFGRCGGCQWQHLDYASQILWKQLIVEEQLKRIGKFSEPNVLPTIPSPKIWNYRSRIKLHKDEKGRSGFYAEGTHDLIEIKECLIADVEAIKRTPEFFTQINQEQNKTLQKEVASIVKDLGAETVLELYCGNGNLTFPLAKTVKKITAADSSRRAIDNAVKEAEKSGVDNIDFICQPSKAVINHMARSHKKFDVLVVDPPRDGCKEIIEGIKRLRPRAIVYISCNPSTLARDLKEISAGGYLLESSQPIDMFPQTYHIETITKLTILA